MATLAFPATGLAPDRYHLSDRQLTAFISHPDGMAAVVAVLARVVGDAVGARGTSRRALLFTVAGLIGVAVTALAWTSRSYRRLATTA